MVRRSSAGSLRRGEVWVPLGPVDAFMLRLLVVGIDGVVSMIVVGGTELVLRLRPDRQVFCLLLALRVIVCIRERLEWKNESGYWK